MDLQEQRALDAASQVAAKVRAHARPWRAIIALVLAIAAAGVAIVSPEGLGSNPSVVGPGHLAQRITWASSVAAFCLFAVIAVVGLAGKARDVLQPRVGVSHAAVVRYTILLAGGIITLVITLALLRISLGQLIVGGALTTILVGIAAQQALGNVFAGIVLLLSRPFAVGDSVLIKSGALGGPIQGIVTEIGITHVRLETGEGLLHLPNSGVLAAGVARVRPTAPAPAAGQQAGLPPPAPPGV